MIPTYFTHIRQDYLSEIGTILRFNSNDHLSGQPCQLYMPFKEYNIDLFQIPKGPAWLYDENR